MTVITVQIIAGRDLASKDSNGLSDPYCYVNVGVPPHSKVNRVKTKTIFKDLNPVWNETFDLEVTDLRESELYIEVWDYDKIGSHDFMGKVQLPITLVEGRKINNWFELQSRGKKSDGEIKGSIHIIAELNKNALKPQQLQPEHHSFIRGISRGTIRRKTQVEDSQVALIPQTPTYRERDKRFIDIVSEKVLDSLSSQERKRQEVIFEFINTEELFRNDIKIICDIFLRRIRNENIFENSADITALFSNIEEILPVTENMVKVLKDLQNQNPVITTLGKALLTQIDPLKVFIKYCSNQKRASTLVEEFRNNREIFAAFLERNEKEEACRSLPLDAFLVKPLQRLCKYPLLLREILKETAEDDPDYPFLIEADRRIKLVVDEANERTRENERLLRCDELRKLLKPTAFSEIMDNNDFELEGTVQYQLTGDSKISEVILILLPTYLIVVWKKKEAKAAGASLRHIDFKSVEDNEDSKNCIDFTVVGGDNFSISFTRSEDKLVWLNTLDKLQIEFFSKIISSRTDSEDILMKEMDALKQENAQLHSQLAQLKSVIPSSDVNNNSNINNVISSKEQLKSKLSVGLRGLKKADVTTPSSPHEEKILIIIRGPSYSGKTTIARDLIAHYNNSGSNPAHFRESNYLSILSNKSEEEVYKYSSSLLLESIRSLVRMDSSYNVIIVEGEFPYSNQIDQFHQFAATSQMKFALFCLQVPLEVRKERAVASHGSLSAHVFEIKNDSFVSDHSIFIDNSGDIKVALKTILTEIANVKR